MSSPTLLCESFERAAYAHIAAMENFRVDGFDESVRQFAQSVDKLQTLAGMQSENDLRKQLGEFPTYNEQDFKNI